VCYWREEEQLIRPYVTAIRNVAVTFLICVDNDIHTLFSGAGWFCERMIDILSDNFCSDRFNHECQNNNTIAVKIIHFKCISLFK
jgi:hypothetical protein